MKIIYLFMLTSIAATGFMNAPAQTADEIINKWIDAMGGKEKLASIKTLYTEGDLNFMNNNAAHKTYLVSGKGFRSETDFNGQNIIDCYTTDSGWSLNPLAGVNTPTDMPAAQVKLSQSQLDAAGPLFNYASRGSKVESMGRENLNGTANYKLKLTTTSGLEITFFIDSTTYYISKEIKKMNADGQDIEIVTVNSDYRKTPEGFIMPFSQELTLPGLSLTITNKKIEVNKEIAAGIFEKPKG